MSETPILNLEVDVPRPKKSARAWMNYLALVPPILVFALLSPDLPRNNLVYLLPALYLGVVVHELGHAIAGLLAGLDVGGICIGGFMMVRSGDRWVFRFSLRWLLNMGGFVVPLPESGEFPRSRFAIFVAAGPAASILLAAVCRVLTSLEGDRTGDWIATLWWASVLLIVVSVTPFSFQGMRSDGMVLWRLFRRPESMRTMMNFLALRTADVNGARPRDWDPALVDAALKTRDDEPYYPMAQIYAWYRCVDQGDEAAGLPHVENALRAAAERGNKVMLRSVFGVAAAASASTLGNVEQARVWLDRARKTGRSTGEESSEGIEARIAIIEGRYEDAMRHWSALREHIAKKKYGNSGTILYLKARIEEGESECRSAMNRAEGAAG